MNKSRKFEHMKNLLRNTYLSLILQYFADDRGYETFKDEQDRLVLLPYIVDECNKAKAKKVLSRQATINILNSYVAFDLKWQDINGKLQKGKKKKQTSVEKAVESAIKKWEDEDSKAQKLKEDKEKKKDKKNKTIGLGKQASLSEQSNDESSSHDPFKVEE